MESDVAMDDTGSVIEDIHSTSAEPEVIRAGSITVDQSHAGEMALDDPNQPPNET